MTDNGKSVCYNNILVCVDTMDGIVWITMCFIVYLMFFLFYQIHRKYLL